MTVRPRKPTAPPSFPLVPHFHVCPSCPRRHKWACPEKRCVWAIKLDCDEAIAAREQFNTEA